MTLLQCYECFLSHLGTVHQILIMMGKHICLWYFNVGLENNEKTCRQALGSIHLCHLGRITRRVHWSPRHWVGGIVIAGTGIETL